MKKIYDKQTIGSKFIYLFLSFLNKKENSLTVDAAKEYIETMANKNKNYNLPLKYGFKLTEYKDMDVYIYNGKIEDEDKKILLYIHGGSYLEQAISFQLRFAQKIAKKTNSILVVPIYPLIPEGDCLMLHSLILNLYKYLRNNNKNDINFLGDSAGGGFVFSFGMELKKLQIDGPRNIISMSPWLDITMNNTNLYKDEKKDLTCGVDGNRYFGELWAKGISKKDYRVSPIYGDFKNIGKITLVFGGREIFTSECLRLRKVLDKQNVEYNDIYFEKEGHDFGVLPTIEGKIIIDNISEIINES